MEIGGPAAANESGSPFAEDQNGLTDLERLLYDVDVESSRSQGSVSEPPSPGAAYDPTKPHGGGHVLLLRDEDEPVEMKYQSYDEKEEGEIDESYVGESQAPTENCNKDDDEDDDDDNERHSRMKIDLTATDDGESTSAWQSSSSIEQLQAVAASRSDGHDHVRAEDDEVVASLSRVALNTSETSRGLVVETNAETDNMQDLVPSSPEPFRRTRKKLKLSSSSAKPNSPSCETDTDSEYMLSDVPKGRRRTGDTKRTANIQDDADEALYQRRLADWCESRRQSLAEEQPRRARRMSMAELIKLPDAQDRVVGRNLRVPGSVDSRLFAHQKQAIEWFYEKHTARQGGLLADDMGLGKTIQVIAFLAALHHSDLLKRPVIIVCETTLIAQWVAEFHAWWPAMKVAVLHGGQGSIFKHDKSVDTVKTFLKANATVGNVVMTTYRTATIHIGSLSSIVWDYVFLDEGDKIKNPDAETTIGIKQLRSERRFVLTGTPVQNDLSELWSIIDFISPGRFATLPTFKEKLDKPIRKAGYVNASDLDSLVGFFCAKKLATRIQKLMLRRTKAQMKLSFVAKSDHVLFCQLSCHQRTMYEAYLRRAEIAHITDGRRENMKKAVHEACVRLQQICNHPDIFLRRRQLAEYKKRTLHFKASIAKREPEGDDEEIEGDLRSRIDRDILERIKGWKFDDAERSGKLVVLRSLLKQWNRCGNKVLIFSKSVDALDVIEKLMHLDGYNYRRMDGKTPPSQRDVRVREFNEDRNVFAFLLTTGVGSKGLNLIGADRVVIYDPHWNPSEDDQSTQRACRPGQTKDVRIYRLMTVGTIEEKIYHRQVFKKTLAKRIVSRAELNDIAYDYEDLHDLFTFTTQNDTDMRYMFGFAEVRTRGRSRPRGRPIAKGRPTARKPRSAVNVIAGATSERPTQPNASNSSKTRRLLSESSTGESRTANAKTSNGSASRTFRNESSGSDSDEMRGVNETTLNRGKNNVSVSRKRPVPLSSSDSETDHDVAELQSVRGVAKVESALPIAKQRGRRSEPRVGRQRKRGATVKQTNERDVVGDLMSTAGLHSAFNNDGVINAKRQRTCDENHPYAREAEALAEAAMREVDREAMNITRNFRLGALTWTGRRGVIGAPSEWDM